MKPIKFPESNFTFTAPQGMSEEQCGDLPCWIGVDSNNSPVIISKWQLTDEELDYVIRTKSIYIQVAGRSTPPLIPYVEHPFNPQVPNHSTDYPCSK